jgi:mono/diheme cytochrome c family protein
MKRSIFSHPGVAATLLILLPSGHGAALATPPPGAEIELWVRGEGKPKDGEVRPERSSHVDIDKLAPMDMVRFDAQYGQAHSFRGVVLATLLSRFAPAAALDLAILHFANGMAVPLPFRDAETMSRLDPFIARGMGAGPKDAIQIGVFPSIPKQDARADSRPITFAGNKVVVADKWHPALNDKVQRVFSPWTHTDSLVSIEFVESKPYYRQFDVSADEKVQRGFALFQQSCQFCHGARQTGARFGWDFVEPMPVYTYRNAQMNLFYHVAYKPIDAAEKGLMMPAMRFMTEGDAGALWQWLRAIATTPMPPYATKAGAAKAAAALTPPVWPSKPAAMTPPKH